MVARPDEFPNPKSERLRSSAGPSGVTSDLVPQGERPASGSTSICPDQGDVSLVGCIVGDTPRTTLSTADAHAILSDVRLRLRGTSTRVPDPLDVAELAATRALVARIEAQLPPRSVLPRWIPEVNSDPHAGEAL
jgi:hypothetical protein